MNSASNIDPVTQYGVGPVPYHTHNGIDSPTIISSATKVTSVTASGSGISATPTTGDVVIANTGVTLLLQGSGIQLTAGTGAVTIASTLTATAFTSGIAQWTNNNTGTQTIAHGLGVTPKFIRCTYISSTVVAGGPKIGGTGAYMVGANQHEGLWYGFDSGGSGTFNTMTGTIIYVAQTAGSIDSSGAVTTVNSTNFIITWSKNGTPATTTQFCWEACG